jgi:RNA polymerase sigma factor (sigma-70 family)
VSDRSSRRYVTIEEVYRRYGADLLRFLHGGHPHLNHQDCEDLLHQAVLLAVARIDQYDPARGSLRMWVLGILRNEVQGDIRRRRREPAADLAAASTEHLEAIEAALRELPFSEREALLTALRTEGEATVEETAARLGIAPASVAVYRQRARERLRRALERQGFEGGMSWRTAPKKADRDPARTR